MRYLHWLTIAVVFSACSDEEPMGGMPMNPMGTPPVTGPVTIQVWRHDNMSYKQANDDAFAEYTAAHSNVTITATPQPWQAYTGALSDKLKRDQFTFDLVLMPPA